MEESQSKGWKFIATVAPLANGKRQTDLRNVTTSPAAKEPCVLIMGNEESGLPPWMCKRADERLAIHSSSKTAVRSGLNSLNVSVAGGILCERFTRRPAASGFAEDVERSSNDKGSSHGNDGAGDQDGITSLW